MQAASKSHQQSRECNCT